MIYWNAGLPLKMQANFAALDSLIGFSARTQDFQERAEFREDENTSVTKRIEGNKNVKKV